MTAKSMAYHATLTFITNKEKHRLAGPLVTGSHSRRGLGRNSVIRTDRSINDINWYRGFGAPVNTIGRHEHQHSEGITMATIHFVKNGKKANGERITRSVGVSMEIATKSLSTYETKHSEKPPTINPEVAASDFAPYRHVVLEVDQGDTNSSFPKQGYYFIVGLDAFECQSIFGLSGPSA